jgi:hypothetical protein
MSRGLGSVGRVIRTMLDEVEAAGGRALALDGAVYARVFPGLNRIEQKHRVTVLRAARSVAARSAAVSWAVDSTRRPPVLHHRYDPVWVWATWQAPNGRIMWQRLRPDGYDRGNVLVTLYGRQHSISGSHLRSHSPGSGGYSSEGRGTQAGLNPRTLASSYDRITVENPLFTLAREGFCYWGGWDHYWTPELEAERKARDAKLKALKRTPGWKAEAAAEKTAQRQGARAWEGQKAARKATRNQRAKARRAARAAVVAEAPD